MGVTDNRYGRYRQSLWVLQTIVMGVADMGGAVERYGQAYGMPFVAKILVLQPYVEWTGKPTSKISSRV